MRLLPLLLVTALLAGCANQATDLTARGGLSEATAAAQQLGDSPQLIAIASIEPLKHMQGEDYEVWVHLDDNPGDGRAPGWMYMFRAEDRYIGIAYAAQMGVIAEGYELTDDEFEDELLESWKLDSTDVARLLDAHEDWPAWGDDVTYTWELWSDDGPKWSVSAFNETMWLDAIIDANTGNITIQEPSWYDYLNGGMEECAMEFDQQGGFVSPLGSYWENIAATSYLYGSLQIDDNLGTTEITVEGSEGVVFSDTFAAPLGGTVIEFELHDLEGGDYELRVENDAGAASVSAVFLSAC